MANPVLVGTPTTIDGTGSVQSLSHTIDAAAEITVIAVRAYLSSGGLTQPTVSVGAETVTFEAEQLGTFGSADDQYAGLFFVDTPTSGAQTVTIDFSAGSGATATTSAVFDFSTVGDSASPFDATAGAEGSDGTPTVSVASTTDDLVILGAGWYNLTRSSVNGGGTSIALDENGSARLSSSDHYLTGLAGSTSPSITLSGSGEWVALAATIGGTGGGGGGGFQTAWAKGSNQILTA